jgi:hypothetical protein
MTEEKGFSRREAIRQLASKYRLSARTVYSRLEEGRKSGV